MKAYVKPAMMALSISANDMLCGSCTAKTRENPELNEGLKWFLGTEWNDKNSDDIVQDGETSVLFDSDDSCSKSYEGYCKYNGAQTSILFSS